jgi:OmpA-OmpF porin, OOP family
MPTIKARLFSIIWLVCAFWGASTVHAQTTVLTNQAGVNASIDVLGATFTPPSAIGPSQARMVFYRASNRDTLPGAIGVFVNGRYHTSLVPGGFSQLCLAPGAVEIGARQFRVGQSARDNFDTVSALELPSSQTQFLSVVEVSGRPVFKPVPANQAILEMAGTRQQMHTISRVSNAQNCVAVPVTPVSPDTPVPPVVAAVQPDQFILSSDALFAFGKSDLAGLTDSGRRSLEHLTARIKDDYVKVERVHVVGHADPLGSAAFNQRLSLERANTVSHFLKRQGQITAPVTSEGKGSRDLVKADCGKLVTNSSIACNSVNRRVVTEVTGQRR